MTEVQLDTELQSMLLEAASAHAVTAVDPVQQLWSGYGRLLRCHLAGGAMPSVIVKHVRWPHEQMHPRGWTTDHSHERKVQSYRIETTWYERYAHACGDACRVPRRLAAESRPDGVVVVLEDLDASGFPQRRTDVGDVELDACLRWLANFHATFMGVAPDGLWATGTYWHLDTRPDELAALDHGPLKSAASIIDRRLSDSPHQTFVHGDAKLANFCFTADGGRAAAVDFQYVGGGCGMKDVAYFIGSCLDEDHSERLAPALLDRYFAHLRAALRDHDVDVDADALEADWRGLYPFAWTDFHRFLLGWSPGHWKLHGYSERLTREVLESLGTEPA